VASHYEGYGFPLLGDGVRLPGLRVGAVIAGDEETDLPPIRNMAGSVIAWHAAGVGELRLASAAKARSRTWDAAARQTAELLGRITRPA
jgi:hypothetical protein